VLLLRYPAFARTDGFEKPPGLVRRKGAPVPPTETTKTKPKCTRRRGEKNVYYIYIHVRIFRSIDVATVLRIYYFYRRGPAHLIVRRLSGATITRNERRRGWGSIKVYSVGIIDHNRIPRRVYRERGPHACTIIVAVVVIARASRPPDNDARRPSADQIKANAGMARAREFVEFRPGRVNEEARFSPKTVRFFFIP